MIDPWTALASLGALSLALASAAAFTDQGPRARRSFIGLEWAAVTALATALAALGSVLWAGATSSPLLGAAGLGLAIRLDVVSAVMLTLVSFIGVIVVRFSRTYLDGEPRQAAFAGWLGLTLAAVMLFVIAGNVLQLLLAWVATGFGLRRLLLFYPDRAGAQRAGRKQFVMARLGDAALVVALAALWSAFGTGDVATILAMAADGAAAPSVATITGAIFLAIAALLMSAQFPSHGWLTEVMEAPTPVSALLHAGVINAGGFLLIRFADVMLLAPGALAVLAVVGGFTAIFGAMTMLTQSAVKTSLAWSTVGQMGFMMMQCGLALFPLALLHIVAHSLYKAHAFLASGSAVDVVSAIRRPGPVAIPNARAVSRAFALALAIYVTMAVAFGLAFGPKSVQAIALGAILILGVAYLIAQGLADEAPRDLTIRTASQAALASLSYFALHAAAAWLTAGVLPAPPTAGPLEWAVITLAILSFGVVAVAQATFPLWAGHPAAAGLRVHLANGLYANALVDRALGSWNVSPRTTTRS